MNGPDVSNMSRYVGVRLCYDSLRAMADDFFGTGDTHRKPNDTHRKPKVWQVADDKKNKPVKTKHSLDNIKLLAEMSKKDRDELAKKCRWIELKPDQPILEEDDTTPYEVYFIVSGEVRVVNYLGDEREVALATLSAGDHFGELSAVDGLKRSAHVFGNEPGLFASLPREDFIKLLTTHPPVALRLLDHFSGIIRTMTHRFSSLSVMTPRQRVYMELLRLCEPNPSGDGSWIIEFMPNHNEIAGWAGTERQQVGEAIGGLVRDGIAERHHKSFVIRDQARLRLLANQ